MQKCKQIISVVLCFVMCMGIIFSIPAKAVTYPATGEISSSSGKAQIYSLPGTTGHEIEQNKNQSQKLCELQNGTQVRLLGEELDGDGDKWYKIGYGDNFENTGYAYSSRVVIKYDYVYDEDFEKNLQNFPESYHDALRSMHAKYPNWQFVAHNIDIDFSNAVDLQYNSSSSSYTANKKLVELNYGGNEWRDIRAYDATIQDYIKKYDTWTYASHAAISYFVDPRNYLNENCVFAFLQQSYNAQLQNKDGLRTVVAGTFLERGYDKDGDTVVDADAYIDDIIAAAEQSGVSPYVLAAAIIVEVGVDGSTVTSGTWEGYDGSYKGYYNFYNWNATGDDVIKNALEFAKQKGWNSPNAAIVGGAAMYAENYVAKGQDTYYYKNYNYVVEPYSSHQFAESIYGSITDAKRISTAFIDKTSGTAVFTIPVFKNMPDTAIPLPKVDSSITVPTVPTPPEPVIKKGDTSGDGSINAIDLADVKMYILGVTTLAGDSEKAADVNGDGAINAIDLAEIKMHILGVKTIS